MFRSLFELLNPRGNGFNSILLSDRGQRQYLLAALHRITAFSPSRYLIMIHLLPPSEPSPIFPLPFQASHYYLS